MYKIGVISDTHGLLREEVLSHLKECDAILHGGDINKAEIMETLSKIAPLYVVRGNNDKGEWAEALPLQLQLNLAGKKFLMAHQKKDIPSDLDQIDVIIYGHSHQYHEIVEEGAIWLNPGSCGKRRFGLPITMAILLIDDKKINIQKIELDNE